MQVDSGRQWFLHAIYTVRSQENADRGIGKRSVHSFMQPWDGDSTDLDHHREKRDTSDVDKLGKESGKGTNMIRISASDPRLKETKVDDKASSYEVANNNASPLDMDSTTGPIIVGLAIFVIILIIFILFVILFRRRNKQKAQAAAEGYGGSQTIPVANGNTRVVAKHRYTDGDQSEV